MFRGAPKITPRHDINLDSIGLTITAAEIDRLKQFDFSQLRDTVAQADPTLLITALETATYAFFTHETFENAQSQIISTIDDVEEQLAAFVERTMDFSITITDNVLYVAADKGSCEINLTRLWPE